MESNTILYKPLGDVIDLLTDYHANGAYEKLKENVTLLDKENHAVMIRTTNFEANDFTNNLIYIDEHAYEFLKKSKVYASDLIMNKIANPGTVYFMPEISKPVSLGMNLFLIRINPKKANPYFVYAYLRKNEHYVKSFASGSTTKTITKDDVRRLKIFMPPLQEQNKITQILSTWDQAISATAKLLKNSQQQKKALMQQLLTGKKRLLDENGQVFSTEWQLFSVMQIGRVITGSTPPKDQIENYGSDFNWATAEDFQGKYINDTKMQLSKTGVRKARLLSKGAVLVTCIASIGKNAIANKEMATNQQINAVEVNEFNSNEFFYYLIEFNVNQLRALAGTTAVAILNKSSFEKIKFKMPSLLEQIKISQVISITDQEVETLQKKLDCLKQEKKALMQQLLTGKKRVKVAA